MTPAIPPKEKVLMNPKNQYMGVANLILPLNIVAIQLKTRIPVGIAMSSVIMPKNELTSAPAPMVKKWCSQTRIEMNITSADDTSVEVYPNKRFREKVETTSE